MNSINFFEYTYFHNLFILIAVKKFVLIITSPATLRFILENKFREKFCALITEKKEARRVRNREKCVGFVRKEDLEGWLDKESEGRGGL